MNVLNPKSCDKLCLLLNDSISLLEENKDGVIKIYQIIRVMKKNVRICIDNEYDFISELTTLLVEDWKRIFHKLFF